MYGHGERMGGISSPGGDVIFHCAEYDSAADALLDESGGFLIGDWMM